MISRWDTHLNILVLVSYSTGQLSNQRRKRHFTGFGEQRINHLNVIIQFHSVYD